MTPAERVAAVLAGIGQAREQARGRLTLRIVDGPGLVVNGAGEVVGVDAWIRLFDQADGEVRVDPHRILVNPPTGVVTDTRRGFDLELGRFVDRKVLVDPDAAFWEALWDSVLRTPNERGWRTRGTVTTVFSGTADGYLTSSSSSSYTDARAGTGSLSADTASTTFNVGQLQSGAKIVTDTCYEGFLSFDTSTITDSDLVTVVTLDVWLVTDNSTTDFTIEARERDWGASLTTGDYVAGASLSGLTLMASIATSGIGATGAYKTLTSQAAFLTATNLKTGTVYLLLDSSRQVGNNDPTGNEYVVLSSADNTGTTQDPKLTITHNAVGSAPFYTSRPLRIWRQR